MDCKDTDKLILHYLNDELDANEKEIVELHLSKCPYCQKEMESLAATQKQLRQSFAVATNKAPSPQAWVNLQERLTSEEQPERAIFNTAKSKMRKRILTTKKELSSRQPAWKPALAGALAAALILSLIFIIPPPFGQSQEVLAAEIAQNDPQIHGLLPEGTIIEVTKLLAPEQEGIFHVLFLIPGESIWINGYERKATAIEALVDVPEREVIELKVVQTEETPIMPLSLTEQNTAIWIAINNRRVQQILGSGAEISNVVSFPPLLLPLLYDNLPPGKTVGVILISPPSDYQIKGLSELESQKWIALVNLNEERVVRITEIPS